MIFKNKSSCMSAWCREWSLEAKNRDLSCTSFECQDTSQIKKLLSQIEKKILPELTMRHQNLMKRKPLHQKPGSISTATHSLLKQWRRHLPVAQDLPPTPTNSFDNLIPVLQESIAKKLGYVKSQVFIKFLLRLEWVTKGMGESHILSRIHFASFYIFH